MPTHTQGTPVPTINYNNRPLVAMRAAIASAGAA